MSIICVKHCPLATGQHLIDYSLELIDTVGKGVCGENDIAMFWTGIKYDTEKEIFIDQNNEAMPENISNVISFEIGLGNCIYSYYSWFYNSDCGNTWPCMNCIVDTTSTY